MSELPHIDAQSVRRLLSWSNCIDAVGNAMRALSTEKVIQPPRAFVNLGEPTMATMIGRSEELPVYGIKVITLDPRNAESDTPAIQGVVALFDSKNSAPVATVDAQSVTAMRTAAASAYASKLLAKTQVRSHGIVGAGVQAESHAQAMNAAFPDLDSTLVWSRDSNKAGMLVDKLVVDIPHSVSPASLEAVCQCDVVSVVTSSHEPVITGEMIRPGSHINLVGTHTAQHREADSSCIVQSRVYVDSLAAAHSEAGDILIPVSEGLIELDHIRGEIGLVDIGRLNGRSGEQEITLYKSVGVFAQDLYVAAEVSSIAGGSN